jgi:hypothetical protein
MDWDKLGERNILERCSHRLIVVDADYKLLV